MSSALIDPFKVAKSKTTLVLTIAPQDMPRLSEVAVSLQEVQAELAFAWDDQRRLRVAGQVSTQLEITCQRCMEPMPLDLKVAVDAAVVWNEEQASQLSSDIDPWLGEDERINLHELLEEELLLALPIMPAHEESDCKGLSSFTTQPYEEPSERPKPFAGLASLMKNTDD